jgi:hypothetical protein
VAEPVREQRILMTFYATDTAAGQVKEMMEVVASALLRPEADDRQARAFDDGSEAG